MIDLLNIQKNYHDNGCTRGFFCCCTSTPRRCTSEILSAEFAVQFDNVRLLNLTPQGKDHTWAKGRLRVEGLWKKTLRTNVLFFFHAHAVLFTLYPLSASYIKGWYYKISCPRVWDRQREKHILPKCWDQRIWEKWKRDKILQWRKKSDPLLLLL